MASDIIYHYCSAESFYKIIQTKEIWLSNVRFMNDLQEGKYIREAIRQVADGEEADNFKKNHKRIYGSAYVSCFSEDNDLWSQWERYADACKGLAIGFCKKQLEILLDTLSSDEPDTLDRKEDINLIKIGYLKKRCLHNRLKEKSPSMFEAIPSDRLTMDGFKNDDFGKTLWTYKNPFFKQEKEHRIVYLLPNNGWASNDKILKPKAYHLTNGGVCDHYPLNFAADNGVVVSVIMGPLTANKKSVVKGYLKDAGLPGAEVSYSDGRGVIR